MFETNFKIKKLQKKNQKMNVIVKLNQFFTQNVKSEKNLKKKHSLEIKYIQIYMKKKIA